MDTLRFDRPTFVDAVRRERSSEDPYKVSTFLIPASLI